MSQTEPPDPRAELATMLPRLRRFARALAGTTHDADDLVQAALEKALSRLDQFQPGSRLDSWMFRIMQTTWIDSLRRRRPTDPIDDTVIQLPGGDGREAVIDRLRLVALSRAMQRLPEEQRAVLAAVAIEGMSYQEAAELLGVPIGTVMSRLARARARLLELTGERAA